MAEAFFQLAPQFKPQYTSHNLFASIISSHSKFSLSIYRVTWSGR